MLLFTRPDAWSGGSYELVLEYGSLSAEAVREVMGRVWAHPSLSGCWLDAQTEPEAQTRMQAERVDGGWLLLGVATLPNGVPIPCSTNVVSDAGEGTWVYVGVPMGSLKMAYPAGAYPFEDGSPRGWRAEVDEWLREMAAFVFATRPFRLGLVGWMIDPETSADEVAASGVPKTRWVGCVVPEAGGLRWYSPTKRSPAR